MSLFLKRTQFIQLNKFGKAFICQDDIQCKIDLLVTEKLLKYIGIIYSMASVIHIYISKHFYLYTYYIYFICL